MQKGKIGVTTDNIFPVIKKFLYSDNEIFLRELVSNAVDATQKLRTLSSFGEFKGELGEMDVRVTVDKEAGTLTVSDHGIGMTAEDVDRYINQIAFSGAEEFLQKYKDTANTIIGHFGLGFYSAFMVAKKVEIRSLSYKEGAEPVKWSCDGSPEYVMEKGDKTERGTDIVLYIDDENKEYLEQIRIDTLLSKYCRFLPVPVRSAEKIINSTQPEWTKKPADLTDEDYLRFYRELYPAQDDPLFWIHLNVDYPFTLTGILYFPKIKNNLDIRKDRIQLYCNQVYVTDSVEGVVPEFMTLLQGVIDSPDIPLNVSRSYLQSDTAVKKISGYITKKVASRLEEIFNNSPQDYEKKWDDIKIFVEYGMLTNEKFAESAMKFALLRDTDGKYYTFDQYKTLVEDKQTDKNGTIIYLYTTEPVEQYTYIQSAQNRGYNVLLMDGQLDNHFVQFLESKLENVRFVRVDSDTIDNLILKEDKRSSNLTEVQRTILTTLFSESVPEIKDANFIVTFEALGKEDMPVVLTQNEFMRRMKDMASMQAGMSFYGDLPDSYNVVVNTDNVHVEELINKVDKALTSQVEPIMHSSEDAEKEIEKLRSADKDNIDAETEQKIKDFERQISDNRDKTTEIVRKYSVEVPVVNQLIDLALLGAGLLKGESLSKFIRRSVDLL